ncbi:MAG: hypothetical protein WAK14_06180 [Methanobacterium sp.]
MIIKSIEITRQKITLQGELKLVDGVLSKHDMEEIISRLVSWKLGPLKPIRHFEMVYNEEKKQVETDVYVTFSIEESSESHVETVKHIFNKLIEFITLYEKEFEAISRRA